MAIDPAATEVLEWWFGPFPADFEQVKVKMQRWFMGGAKLDPEVREKFGARVEQAVNGGLREWESTVEGRLALIILLDQLTRHVYRDQRRMYDGDARAQVLARGLFDSGQAQRLRVDWRHFAMMPFVHAEDLALQRRSVQEVDALIAAAPPHYAKVLQLGVEQSRKYLGVIERFGRFPHRNAILGRQSTPEEIEFMKTFVGPPTESAKKLDITS